MNILPDDDPTESRHVANVQINKFSTVILICLLRICCKIVLYSNIQQNAQIKIIRKQAFRGKWALQFQLNSMPKHTHGSFKSVTQILRRALKCDPDAVIN
jgi:hypothetical protein